MSGYCEGCPALAGLNDQNDWIESCPNPPVPCVKFRESLGKRVTVWNRFAAIAEVARSGIVDIDAFPDGIVMQLLMSRPGKPWGEDEEVRKLLIFIDEKDEEGIRGKVIIDSYETDNEGESDNKIWAIAPDTEISIHGWDFNGHETKGELKVGQSILFTPSDTCRIPYDLVLQELTLMDMEAKVQMDVFGTDPRVFRQS